MIISDTHRLVFIQVPKCASSTVRRQLTPIDTVGDFFHSVKEHPALGQIDYFHIPLDPLRAYFPEAFAKLRRYASFAICRDPYRRFKSALAQYARGQYGTELTYLSGAARRKLVDRAIGYLSRNPEGLAPEFIHFARQERYLCLNGEKVVRHIYPIERVDAMLGAMSARTGRRIEALSLDNPTLYYPSRRVEIIVKAGNRLARAALPPRLYAALKSRAQNVLRATDRPAKDTVLTSETVCAFIAEFYAGDLAIHRACLDRFGVRPPRNLASVA